jgi:hypothetical protein
MAEHLSEPVDGASGELTEARVIPPRPRPSRAKRIGGQLVKWGSPTLIVGWGVHQITKGDNLEDFQDLAAFTSADHQQDRQEAQDAQTAQGKIHDHFEAQGGLTAEEANAMAPIVGLEPDEMQALVAAELFPMDYDGDVAVASSQEATYGVAALMFGAGLIAATGIGAARRRFGH